MGFSACIALWVLSVVPLARESMDGREGADVVAVYLAVGAISLGVAAVIRGLYVLLRRRREFWSPWVFLIAALLAIAIYGVQSAGDKAVPLAGAQARESSTAIGAGRQAGTVDSRGSPVEFASLSQNE